ncbi:hypothetical protein BVK87_18830, partial [Achromobacter denitrificans]
MAYRADPAPFPCFRAARCSVNCPGPCARPVARNAAADAAPLSSRRRPWRRMLSLPAAAALVLT